MSDIYKVLLASNDNEKILTKFLSLILEKNEKESLKFLYELISFLISEINTKNINSLIALIKEKNNKNSSFKEFLDYYLGQYLWIFGTKNNIPQSNLAQKKQNNEKEKKENSKEDNFKAFVNLLINEKLITKKDLIEKLEEKNLEQIGLMTQEAFIKEFARINTKSFEHNKFNLLREESEGYSKLISFLFDINELQKKLDEKEIKTILEKIVKIIGNFDLDSYRVLDIALEIFKYSPFNLNYIKIFDILNKKAILPIIDFKFSENQNDKKLMIIFAQLIHFNYISLEDFILHINPSLTELQQIYINKYKSIYEYIQKSLYEDIKSQISSLNDISSSNKTANYFCNYKEIILKSISKANINYKNNNLKKYNKNNQFYLLLESFIVIRDKQNIIKMHKCII